MRSLAIVVPAEAAETVRQRLAGLGVLRSDLKVGRFEGAVGFPIRHAPEPPIPGTTIEEREFEERPADGPARYLDLLDVPSDVAARLPRSFDIVGDIVLLRLEPELDPWASAVGEALRRFVPGARLVAIDDGVHGPARVRALRPIAGTGGFRTVHRENGLALSVELDRAYFSPRLGREHARVAESARDGETVLDLCCGIGPFGLTLLARYPRTRVTFVDLNPAAIALLRENLHRLGATDRATVVEGSIEGFRAPSDGADRVVLNLPHEGIKYLAKVAGAVAVGGRLHHYEIMERLEAAVRIEAARSSLPGPGSWRVVDQHPVHPYSPSSDLVAVTFERPRG